MLDLSFLYQADYIKISGQTYPIMQAALYKDCYANGNIIGTAIAKQLVFTIDASAPIDGATFEHFCGLGTDNVTYRSTGTYIVIDLEQSDTNGYSKVTAVDYMLRFNTTYASTLDYASGNVTLLDVLRECCEDCGVPLAEGQTLGNESFIVDSNQFTDGQMYRDVIAAIAGINGTFAQIVNDELVFVHPKQSNASVLRFDTDSYASVDVRRTTHPINTVVIGSSQIDGENITKIKSGTAESDQNQLQILDNPFAYTQEKRELLIDALYDSVVDWGYMAFELTGLLNPFVECGDMVSIELLDGTVIQSYAYRISYFSPDGVKSITAAPSVTKAAIDYLYTPTAAEIAKRTQIIVDKAEGQITSLASEQQEIQVSNDSRFEELEQRIQTNQTLIEQTANQIKASMSETGGSNMLANSVGYKDLAFWETSDPINYQIIQDAQTDQHTTSGSGIQLTNGTIRQSFYTQQGMQYAVQFAYNKAGIASAESSVVLTADGTSIDVLRTTQEEDGYQDVLFVFEAQQPEYTLVISTSNDAFAVYDLRITAGDSGQAWSQGKDEVYGKGVLLDKTGITINPLEAGNVSMTMDNDSLYISDGGTLKAEVSDERIYGPYMASENGIRIGDVEIRGLTRTRLVLSGV